MSQVSAERTTDPTLWPQPTEQPPDAPLLAPTAIMSIETARGLVALPCMMPQIVPIEQVRANAYNPNHVSPHNMDLLLESILANGFCFPVVVIYDESDGMYEVVDGFHRYLIFRDYLHADVLPVVVLRQSMAERMEATVQFNRARGVHQVDLMGDLVRKLIEQGVPDEEIATKLGMEAEEVYRLKQITGIAALFAHQVYSRAWEMVDTSGGHEEEEEGEEVADAHTAPQATND